MPATKNARAINVLFASAVIVAQMYAVPAWGQTSPSAESQPTPPAASAPTGNVPNATLPSATTYPELWSGQWISGQYAGSVSLRFTSATNAVLNWSSNQCYANDEEVKITTEGNSVQFSAKRNSASCAMDVSLKKSENVMSGRNSSGVQIELKKRSK
jgi:hypothetical protein